MPNYISQIHGLGGTFLGGYSGYDMNTIWNTVVSGYLQTNGHFMANNDYGFDAQGSPYMALVDKSTMEIISYDAVSLINDMNSVVNQCEQMAP